MITYPLTFPDSVSVNGLKIKPRDAVSSTESPFSFVEQTYDWGGEIWEVDGSLPLMTREVAEEYFTFLLKLKGRKGTFLLPVPNAKTPLGVATGTPLVDGGSQTGNNLDIKGFTPSVTGILKAGDYIQLGTGVNTRLHKVLDTVDSDGSGNTTVLIWPSLRESPSDNDVVKVSNCSVLLRLKSSIEADIDINKLHLLSFSAREALNG